MKDSNIISNDILVKILEGLKDEASFDENYEAEKLLIDIGGIPKIKLYIELAEENVDEEKLKLLKAIMEKKTLEYKSIQNRKVGEKGNYLSEPLLDMVSTESLKKLIEDLDSEDKDTKERALENLEKIASMGLIKREIGSAELYDDYERRELLERIKGKRFELYKMHQNVEYSEDRYLSLLEISTQSLQNLVEKLDNGEKTNLEKFEIDAIGRAIVAAEEYDDKERIELLKRIKNAREIIQARADASRIIHNIRYMNLNGEKVKVTDESLLEGIERFFGELDEEASAGYALNSLIYVYSTNAKDKDDLLKRLEIISSKLKEYEKVKSEISLKYVGVGIDTAKKDFESGDILGIDKNVEER